MSTDSESTAYAAYGLTIASSRPLPALATLEEPAASRADADLVIEETSIPASPSALPADAALVHREPDSFAIYRSQAGLHWFYADLGGLRVRDGRLIEVDVAPSAPDRTVQQLVLGAGVYSALVQRGRPVLHASAVAIGDAAVAFLGATGRGKSTAAAACYAAGHEVVADDVTALAVDDGSVRVESAFPRLRVSPAAADALDLEVAGPGPTDDERVVDVQDGFRDRPARLDAIYLLEDGDGPPRSDRVSGRQAVFELLRAGYVLAPDDDTDALGAHQRSMAAVASATEVRRLVRPRSFDALDDLVALVEADVDPDTVGGLGSA